MQYRKLDGKLLNKLQKKFYVFQQQANDAIKTKGNLYFCGGLYTKR